MNKYKNRFAALLLVLILPVQLVPLAYAEELLQPREAEAVQPAEAASGAPESDTGQEEQENLAPVPDPETSLASREVIAEPEPQPDTQALAEPVNSIEAVLEEKVPELGKLKSSVTAIFNRFAEKHKVVGRAIEYTHRTLSGAQEAEQPELSAGTDSRDYVEGEIIVKYKDGKIDLDTKAGQKAALTFLKSESLEPKESIDETNLAVVIITDQASVEEKVAELNNDSNVEYAQPNYKRYPVAIDTDDTFKDFLWGLDNIGQEIEGQLGTPDADMDAPEAWAINEGTNGETIVAVIDTGVAYNHPDLQDNMWDGTDCVDENGDPIPGGCNHGYDFEDNDNTPLPTDTYVGSHGTHVAGIIAAQKNNGEGVVGIAPNAKIMALKFAFDDFSEIKAIDFAIQNGAKIINASYGGSFFSQAEYDAISRFRDAGGIFVAAAGNYSSDNDEGEDYHLYPSDYDLDNIISVAATDLNDELASFSSYGSVSVDVGAPGQDIYSTFITDTATEEALYEESFEGVSAPAVPSGWIKGGTDNNWGTYHFGRGFFMGNVLYGDVVNLPYAPSADTTITSPAIDLTADEVEFGFSTQCDTEYDEEEWTDYMALEFSNDSGDTFTEVLKWDEMILDAYNGEYPLNENGGSVYNFQGFPVPEEYLNSNFKFQLRWIADGDADVGGGEGCSVNDIKFTKITHTSSLDYSYASGTSMATPYVAGLAALLWGYQPNLIASEVKDAILENGDPLPSLEGKTVTGKRINAFNTLSQFIPVPDSTLPVITLIGNSVLNVKLGSTFTDPGVTATDDVDGDITADVIVGGDTVDTNVLGTYVITYNVTDSAGNAAEEVTRTVKVSKPSSGGGGGGKSNPPVPRFPQAQGEACSPGDQYNRLNGEKCPGVPVLQANAPYNFTLLLRAGSTGNEVVELQKKLALFGDFSGKVDGKFGPVTQNAIKALQAKYKLTADGIVGPMTRMILNSMK